MKHKPNLEHDVSIEAAYVLWQVCNRAVTEPPIQGSDIVIKGLDNRVMTTSARRL